jgi:DNA-binding transcriptional ArsR family regulator
MLKADYHPNAFLTVIRNNRNGLLSRTKILRVLEKSSGTAISISKKTGLTYGVVNHHLRLLEAEGIVRRKGDRQFIWELTGLGQKRLAS